MVKKFSIEEVPVENNIPLEPLLPTGAGNDTPKEHSSGSGSPEEEQSPKKTEPLPMITVTSANGDHVITRIKHAEDKEGDDTAQHNDQQYLALADELSRASSGSNQMALYEEDIHHQGKISALLNRLANYHAGIEPNTSERKKTHAKARLGTLLGVYLPCIQNIFGVLLFIRMTWIVGMAGAIEGFLIVLVCCGCTLLTAISMSAIATNGVVPAGGSYFMISRALGPEFGGAVGILFYLGTTVASSMYIIGAIEILVTYMAQEISLFGDVSVQSNALNNYRVYGTAVLLLLGIIVFIGVAFVSKFATLSLACVILSILCIYIGIFAASPDRSVHICYLGERLLTSDSVTVDGVMMCIKNETGPIFKKYCHVGENETTCDPYFEDNPAYTKPGIPGLTSNVFHENLHNKYTYADNIIGQKIEGNRDRGEIIADITSSFMVLLAIYFPSVTGIMAGSNRSGDLEDAQKSIPTGTLSAITTTSIVYVTCTFFFAGTIEGDLLRDKLGESINGGLVVAYLAWPTKWVILIGSFLSTVGAGLQSLTGAPRLLQAIAMDGVIPVINFFSVTTKRGEPFRALLLTLAISEIGILIANLDVVAPVITMFFLMCYGFVNMACALQTLLRTPSWRPRFKFYHWILSLIGLALCVVLMFISSWYYAITAMAIAAFVYKYIEYKGAEKEWGDGIRGLAMSAARYSLLRVQQGPPHTKNWRPQLLVLFKLDDELQPKYSKMVEFASQLKAGKGLTLVTSVLEGKWMDRFADAQAAKQNLQKVIDQTGVKGFADVVVTESVTSGLCHLVQNSGLGGLRHNTVMLGWPYGWRHNIDERSYKVFLDTVNNIGAGQMALLVIKGANHFPASTEKLKGTIDIWWIVHDGGLLMLLPFLLKQHKTWKNCKLRIFTVAQLEDNTIQMKNDLQKFMYQLRIQADVEVVEMAESDITAYTYERTLIMEQRTEMLKNMRVGKIVQPQSIVDNSRASLPEVTVKLDTVTEESTTDEEKLSERNQYTFSPNFRQEGVSMEEMASSINKNVLDIKPDQKNVRRMHTAVRLNEVIIQKSHEAKLVILNLPAPPKHESGELNYMEFLEVLTEGLDTVLMVRGSGSEVITIYS
ncbi:solute carrier family 12 member 6-like isoform X2 [Mercenaria mercenaria]|uniref:solute carrier family 12 member 6-like isoform X2 n=1 Tax=Mercenaria mercenaria TaxID=6596 RepID=UPI00234FAD76|nr:solute carrier family 12 member 6-like isoform X2 [Mercenaria mercenaria]